MGVYIGEDPGKPTVDTVLGALRSVSETTVWLAIAQSLNCAATYERREQLLALPSTQRIIWLLSRGLF